MTSAEQPTLTVVMPIVFRAATHADLPKLEWYGQYAHFRHLFARAFREQQQGRRLMLLADSAGFPIGHIFIQFTSNTMVERMEGRRSYLYSLRVMEMFRGQGIGTRLIQEAEQALQARRAQWATIAVAKENGRARRLYERLGYRIFGEDPGFWSYRDHEGLTRNVQEPCWLLQKEIRLR